MTTRTLSTRARWAVPVVAVGLVAGAAILPSALAASSTPDLPTLSASELVQKIAAADPVPVSGSVVYTSRLGLPDLAVSSMQGAGPINLLGGSSSMRVWTDGTGSSRVSLLGELSEYTVVDTPDAVWTYSSSTDEAVHYTVSATDLAAYQGLKDDPAANTGTEVPTPESIAAMALTAVETTADVTVDATAKVAGRDVYQLTVDPKTDGTLVAKIQVAVDGQTFVPLRARVWSTQDPAAPALEVAFTDVSFNAADPAVFTFTPPPGAAVRDVEIPLPAPADLAAREGATPTDSPAYTVHGTGWETVIEIPDVDLNALLTGTAPSADEIKSELSGSIGSESADQLYTDLMGADSKQSHGMTDLDPQALFDQLTTTVPEGKIISATLLTVLITDDGRAFIGAVPVTTLQALAR